MKPAPICKAVGLFSGVPADDAAVTLKLENRHELVVRPSAPSLSKPVHPRWPAPLTSFRGQFYSSVEAWPLTPALLKLNCYPTLTQQTEVRLCKNTAGLWNGLQ